MSDKTMKGGAALVICSIVGWVCIAFEAAALYNGGEPQHGNILRSLSSGNTGYALGAFFGGTFPAIVALIMGIVIRKHSAGVALMVVSGILMLIGIITM